MFEPGRPSRATSILVAILLLGIVVAGVALRAREPERSPVMAAEDPYTHVVFIKEWLQTGAFGDSTYLGTSMYPPGLHALSGALASDGGIDLYVWAMWFPIALGAIAIVGMFVLGNRLGGPAAGLAAALLVAAMPEHAFRTELFFPTALDLAVLPLMLLAFIVALETQEISAAAFFVLLSVPLAFAHPWAVPLFVVPLFGYACLRVMREATSASVAARSMVLPIGMVAVSTAFAVASRWDHTETGFATFLGALGPLRFLSALNAGPPLVFAVILAVSLAAGVFALLVVCALALARQKLPRVVRLGIGALIAIALILAVRAMAPRAPSEVNYDHMLGTVAIMLSLVGLALALVAPTKTGDMGLALSLWLFPLTALNLFHSQFWPQRTVAYLTLGVALLGAAAVGYAATSAVSLVRNQRASRFVAPAAVLASVLLLSGAMAAAPSKQYVWYRLYTDDGFATLHDISVRASNEPNARVVVPGWQSGLMVKTFANLDVPWYSPKFYQDEGERAKILGQIHGPAYVVVDTYVEKAAAKGQADLGFLSGAQVVARSNDGSVTIYQMGG